MIVLKKYIYNILSMQNNIGKMNQNDNRAGKRLQITKIKVKNNIDE